MKIISKLSALCAGALMALALIPVPQAHACEQEFGDSYYRLTPLQNDGLSNAQRTQCSRGTLAAYNQTSGWVNMVDPNGQQIVAQDFRGIRSGDWDFMVAVGPNGEVVMRWGDMAGGVFFVNDDTHSTFMMPVIWNGQEVPARMIDGLEFADGGRLLVGVITATNFECTITSKADLTFDGQWDCIAPH